MKKTKLKLQKLIYESIQDAIYETIYDDMDDFQKYNDDYPDEDIDYIKNMDKQDLVRYCKNGGDFLYIYPSYNGDLKLMNANSSDIVNDIIKDISNCAYIEPTHEVDYILNRRYDEFRNMFVCIFKLISVVGDDDYYVVYQEPKAY